MPQTSIAKALRLLAPGQPAQASFTYYLPSSLPTYASGQSTGYSATPNGSPYLFGSTSAFVPLSSITDAVAVFGASVSNITAASGVTITAGASTAADIVAYGLSVQLYSGSTAVYGFAPWPGFYGDGRDSDLVLLPNGQASVDLAPTMMHEMLHTLGLRDVDDVIYPEEGADLARYTIMGRLLHPGEQRYPTEPLLYDIAALQALYGRNTSTGAGTSVYDQFTEAGGFFQGQDRIFCIWDASGNDTIDASALNAAALIDLRPGYFSSIGPGAGVSFTGGSAPAIAGAGAGTLNVSIAFGAYIENATGSSTGDFIIGNLLSNRLEGGDGADVIYGEGADSVYEAGDGTYNQVSGTAPGNTESAPTGIVEFVRSHSQQQDHLLGDGGADYLHGGRGNDLIEGGAGNDYIVGGAGDDEIWGGDKDDDQGTGDGVETLDYSGAGPGAIVTYASSSGTASLTVADGTGGTDTLHSIERIIAGSGHGKLQFTGSGTGATVDLTDVEDGFILASQDSAEVRLKGVSEFIGGDALTTFIGRTGTPSIFRAGSGGGDFTLASGDVAYGQSGAVDIFRVTTTVPVELNGCTEAEKVAYLASNRNFIHNFGAEDFLYVNGVMCTGNTVTAVVGTAVSSDYNRDLPVAYVALTGDSSYGTSYAQPTFDQQGLSYGGQPWGAYLYSAGEVRDASFHRAGDDLGVISFMSRTITPDAGDLYPGYKLDALASTDEMLVIVIDGFEDGYGGMSFTNDPLANLARPSPFDETGQIYTYTNGVSWAHTDRIWVGFANDLDGNNDGYLEGGGTPIDSDSEDFNFGATLGMPTTGWEAFALGADLKSGTEDPDTLDGGTGDDILQGNDGDDTLIGGDGDDQLFGGAGEDLLIGNAGNDLLDGGSDVDEMVGGTGDDTYVVDDEYDIVTEDADAGNDTILTTLASFTLSAANVENLGYSGFGNFTGTGGASDNLLSGGSGDDILSGEDGDDSFRTSDGSDLIDGGDGTDTILVTGNQWTISLSETLGVVTLVDYNFSSSSSELTSVERIHFSDLDQSFTIAEVLDPSFTGTNGDDDPLEGNGLDNQIYGLDGDDMLIGAGGYDTLYGGDGTDTAWFAGTSIEYRAYLDTDGSAFVDSLASEEASDWLVDMEAIYFAGDNATVLLSALPAMGTSGNDILTGSARPDALFGWEGNDSLDGLAGDDTLDGGEGDDLYFFGTGNDSAYDYDGDDGYVYELGDGDDIISDQAGTDYLSFGSGIDPLEVTVTDDGDGGYYLTLAGGGSVWLQYATEPSNTIEEVRFADSTVWTDEDLYDLANGSSFMRGGGNNAILTAPHDDGALLWDRAEMRPVEYIANMGDLHVCIP
jgi:Ca2+-binding RTX toxin-like protein